MIRIYHQEEKAQQVKIKIKYWRSWLKTYL